MKRERVKTDIALLPLEASDRNQFILDNQEAFNYSSFLSVKENTMVRYREDIDLYIKPLLGKIRLRELRTIQIQAFYNKLLQQGLSVKTVRNIHGVVHASLERAVKTDLLNKNVSNNCVLPKFRQAEMHPLQGDEVARKEDHLVSSAAFFLLRSYTLFLTCIIPYNPAFCREKFCRFLLIRI